MKYWPRICLLLLYNFTIILAEDRGRDQDSDLENGPNNGEQDYEGDKSWNDYNKCLVKLKGETKKFFVGEIWHSENPCVMFICAIDEYGKAEPQAINEECKQRCKRGYEMQVLPGKCCGPCIKTKCFFHGKMYSIGESWFDDNACLGYKCVKANNTADAKSFIKPCPDLPKCSPNDVYTKDCCLYCHDQNSWQFRKATDKEQIDSYKKHPCKRICVSGDIPMICQYKFIVEWYQTLSKACFNCPINITDCYRPHCITGDGIRKPVLVVNRMMPGPAIEVCEGDTIIVDVSNELSGEVTTIHWHGLPQKNFQYMDGVPSVTQCPILPHTTFRYKFAATPKGTYLWHSHVELQRADGCFGPLIIRKPDELLSELYDFDLSEHIIVNQDWIHTDAITLFTNHIHSTGGNKPVNILVNGKGGFLNPTNVTDLLKDVPFEVFCVTQGARYRFRVINSGFLNCPMEISIDRHIMLVISSDGHDIEPIEVTSLVTYAGERFDFILMADQEINTYWIRFKGLMDCDERFGKVHQVAILHYEDGPDVEPFDSTDYDYPVIGLQLNALNKGPGQYDSITVAELRSLEEGEKWISQKDPDYKFYLHYDFNPVNSHSYYPPFYTFDNVADKFYTPQFNRISLKTAPVALLPARYEVDESIFCNETSLKEQGINCTEQFCQCLHVLKVPWNAVVEVILVDEGCPYDSNHPIHLHGYSFRVLGMDRIGDKVTVEQIMEMDNNGLLMRNFERPPKKDTVTVSDGGYTIFRFKADNVGYWLFHCHNEFHSELGMALIFKVGENIQMPRVPKNFPTCSNYMPDI